MSKEQFQQMREIEVLEAIDVSQEVQEEIIIELTNQFEGVDETKVVVSDASPNFSEMPRDFWNHGFNGHSGFCTDRAEAEIDTIKRYYR